MQPLNGRIAGDDKIGVVAEPLQTAIPNISMDIIIGSRGQPKKFNVPDGSQDEPDDDDTSGKSQSNFGASKNSRIANKYAIPAAVNVAMNHGPPRSPKFLEQIVSATHKVAPRMYTLHSEETFTVLPRRSDGPSESLLEMFSWIAPPRDPSP